MPVISDAVAQKAAAIQSRLNSAVTSARNDQALTPLGKRQRMARAYLEADQAMSKLKDEWQASAATAKTVLGKDIFGAASTLGADAISTRDADDRAARISSPGEALSLLTRAEENGDAVLARAIAQRAYSERGSLGDFGGGWSQVMETYVSTRPQVAAKLEELTNARREDVASSLRAGMVFSLHRPMELNGIGNLETAAAEVSA